MPETTNDDAPTWMTLALHPPSPNCKFAAFVRNVDGALVCSVLPVDFVAIQEQRTIGDDPDGDDDDVASRTVPLIIEWTGKPLICSLDGGDDAFVACAPTFEDAEARARAVVARLEGAAAPPAAP